MSRNKSIPNVKDARTSKKGMWNPVETTKYLVIRFNIKSRFNMKLDSGSNGD